MLLKKVNKIGLMVSLIIMIGVFVSSSLVYLSYRKVISNSTRSIAELSAMNIYSEINSELTKPIYVSLTMANDSFVKNWLSDEENNSSDLIVDYLFGIQEKYEYSSVFLVSNQTLDYYRYTGYHKTVSESDTHDVWYYDFINQDKLYDLDVDVDQANNTLTIFVNAKIMNGEELVGVVGVGVEMNYVQAMILDFESKYDLEAFLVLENGLVQSHTNTEYIESRNIFEEELYLKHETEILSSLEEMIISQEHTTFVISRYVDELDWYIIVTKDSHLLINFLLDYFFFSFTSLILIVISVYTLVSKLTKKHQNQVDLLARQDYLTKLNNRRGFEIALNQLDKVNHGSQVLYMIDIDNFKQINDQYGHVFGDEILRTFSSLFEEQMGPNGIVSRWGGDEFSGIYQGSEEDFLQDMNQLIDNLSKIELFQPAILQISCGYTILKNNDIDFSIKQADMAMYESKSKGGHQITKK